MRVVRASIRLLLNPAKASAQESPVSGILLLLRERNAPLGNEKLPLNRPKGPPSCQSKFWRPAAWLGAGRPLRHAGRCPLIKVAFCYSEPPPVVSGGTPALIDECKLVSIDQNGRMPIFSRLTRIQNGSK